MINRNFKLKIYKKNKKFKHLTAFVKNSKSKLIVKSNCSWFIFHFKKFNGTFKSFKVFLKKYVS